MSACVHVKTKSTAKKKKQQKKNERKIFGIIKIRGFDKEKSVAESARTSENKETVRRRFWLFQLPLNRIIVISNSRNLQFVPHFIVIWCSNSLCRFVHLFARCFRLSLVRSLFISLVIVSTFDWNIFGIVVTDNNNNVKRWIRELHKSEKEIYWQMTLKMKIVFYQRPKNPNGPTQLICLCFRHLPSGVFIIQWNIDYYCYRYCSFYCFILVSVHLQTILCVRSRQERIFLYCFSSLRSHISTFVSNFICANCKSLPLPPDLALPQSIFSSFHIK